MLEKLFTSKNRIKILEFFLLKKDESHIREISRELKIPVSAVKREVDNLKSINIFEINKNKIILNKKCNFLEEIRNIFIKTDFIVYPIQETFEKIKADFVFIFGSFAGGGYKEESDIDLMIIGAVSLSAIIKIIGPIEDKIKRSINPVVWTAENLKKQKKSGFVKDIFVKKIIMIKGEENELRKIIK